jgi:hypothetical protein
METLQETDSDGGEDGLVGTRWGARTNHTASCLGGVARQYVFLEGEEARTALGRRDRHVSAADPHQPGMRVGSQGCRRQGAINSGRDLAPQSHQGAARWEGLELQVI